MEKEKNIHTVFVVDFKNKKLLYKFEGDWNNVQDFRKLIDIATVLKKQDKVELKEASNG